MWRDRSGKALDEYWRPSLAVDAAVLTAGPRRPPSVLLVRWKDTDGWGLPGTFLHEGSGSPTPCSLRWPTRQG